MAEVIFKHRGRMDAEKAMKYKEFLGHPLTQAEMRLIPYVQYCAVNQGSIDRRHINAEEKIILKQWTEANMCMCYPFNVCVAPTREFWDFMCNVLWDFYSVELSA